MTDREYELLEFISSKGPLKWYEVLNAFGPVTEGKRNSVILEKALEDKMIKSVGFKQKGLLRTVQIDNKGILALMDYEDQLQKEASIRAENIRREQNAIEEHNRKLEAEAVRRAEEVHSQYRHDWRVALTGSVVGTVLGVVGTLLAQYLSEHLF